MNAKRQAVCDAEDIVGLDINDGRLVAAHFVRSSDKMTQCRIAIGRFDAGSSDRQISTYIRDFWKKEKLPSRLVRTCLYSRALVVRYYQYTNLNVNELAMALALEAEEALQRPANEICIDWSMNRVAYTLDGGQAQLSGTLVAAPRKTVKRHLDMIRAAGLYSVNVEVSCSASCNLYSSLFGNHAHTPVCLVNMANRTADIIMCADGNIYPRTLFSADDGWEANTEYLMENIQNALLYYHLRVKYSPVEKVLLLGAVPDPVPFCEKLARKVSLPVEPLNICEKLGIHKDDPVLKSGCNIVTASGLALRKELNDDPL